MPKINKRERERLRKITGIALDAAMPGAGIDGLAMAGGSMLSKRAKHFLSTRKKEAGYSNKFNFTM